MVDFKFDAVAHEYVGAGGQVLPHITGMLEQAGLTNSQHYTEESRERGTAVHRLTMLYDLGSLTDVIGCTSHYKGWLQSHVKAMDILRPTWVHVEDAMCNGVFGGRPDRVGHVFGIYTVVDIKSGGREKAHRIQTALQAILASVEGGMPPDVIYRAALYLQRDGHFKYEEHKDLRDFHQAKEIIAHCCGRV